MRPTFLRYFALSVLATFLLSCAQLGFSLGAGSLTDFAPLALVFLFLVQACTAVLGATVVAFPRFHALAVAYLIGYYFQLFINNSNTKALAHMFFVP